MTWREFRRATVQLIARISDQPGNVCDDRRVTTPRCIVNNEDSGMKNLAKSHRGTKIPCSNVNEYPKQPVRGHRPDGCHNGSLPPGARRRPTVTLGGLYSFRMPSFIQGLKNYIASPWTQYSFDEHISQEVNKATKMTKTIRRTF